MDSFAEKDIEFDDGQNNKEPIPDEIQQYGYRPPIRAKDGKVIKGHRLAAPHLNYIFNDLYKEISNLKSQIKELQSK